MLDYEDQTVWVGRNLKKVKAELESSGRPVVALRASPDSTLVQPLTDPITRDLESLQLNGWSKGAARDAFLACERLRQLRSLNLFNIQPRSPHRIVEQLLGAVRFERLESLDLDGSALGDDGVAALAASPSLAKLQSLKLSSCDLSEESVEHLAGSKHLGQLRELDLEFNQLSLDAAARLVTSPRLPRLESLSISGEFGKRFAAFTSLEGPARLRSLVLGRTRTSRGLLAALSNAPALSELRSLTLRTATLGAADAPFAQGAAMQNLESLSLIDVRVSAATLASLLDGPALSKLRSLVLWSTPLRDVGAEAPAASPTLSRLDALRVDTCTVGDAGAKAIASSPHLAALHELEWRSMRSGDALLARPRTHRPLRLLDRDEGRQGPPRRKPPFAQVDQPLRVLARRRRARRAPAAPALRPGAEVLTPPKDAMSTTLAHLRFADEVRGVGFGAASPVFPWIGPSATGNARKTPSRKAARVVRGEGFEPP